MWQQDLFFFFLCFCKRYAYASTYVPFGLKFITWLKLEKSFIESPPLFLVNKSHNNHSTHEPHGAQRWQHKQTHTHTNTRQANQPTSQPASISYGSNKNLQFYPHHVAYTLRGKINNIHEDHKTTTYNPQSLSLSHLILLSLRHFYSLAKKHTHIPLSFANFLWHASNSVLFPRARDREQLNLTHRTEREHLRNVC